MLILNMNMKFNKFDLIFPPILFEFESVVCSDVYMTRVKDKCGYRWEVCIYLLTIFPHCAMKLDACLPKWLFNLGSYLMVACKI